MAPPVPLQARLVSGAIGSLLPLILGQLPLPAQANPARYGDQLCVMLNSGIPLSRAWDHLVFEHIRSAPVPAAVVLPGSASASMGWALGSGWARIDRAHRQMQVMKADVLRVARSLCPARFPPASRA